jgi:hypothetical protein
MEKPYKLFISYAHEDESYRRQLDKHLSTLTREGLISPWHDRKITPGSEWAGEIDKHLETSDVILLLISPDFIASEYSNDIEVKKAIERHENNEAVVVPIILRHADWATTYLSKLQALPKDAEPISSWSDEDEAFLDVVKGLRWIINNFEGKGKLGGGKVKYPENSKSPSHKIEERGQVDFSGKLDSYNDATVAVYANKITRSIFVPFSVKTTGIELLKSRYPHLSKLNIRIKLLSIIIYYLIKDLIHEVGEVVIDDEYPGHGGAIKTTLLNLLKAYSREVDPSKIKIKKLSGQTKPYEIAHELRKLPDKKLRVPDITSLIK